MSEKYCSLPKSICEFGTGEKADCENCELNERFSKRTIDNWESYIVDNKTGKEYGTDIDRLLDLLNEQEKEIQRLNLIIDGFNYALKNIRQIAMEIDLNECGDSE